MSQQITTRTDAARLSADYCGPYAEPYIIADMADWLWENREQHNNRPADWDDRFEAALDTCTDARRSQLEAGTLDLSKYGQRHDK